MFRFFDVSSVQEKMANYIERDICYVEKDFTELEFYKNAHFPFTLIMPAKKFEYNIIQKAENGVIKYRTLMVSRDGECILIDTLIRQRVQEDIYEYIFSPRAYEVYCKLHDKFGNQSMEEKPQNRGRSLLVLQFHSKPSEDFITWKMASGFQLDIRPVRMDYLVTIDRRGVPTFQVTVSGDAIFHHYSTGINYSQALKLEDLPERRVRKKVGKILSHAFSDTQILKLEDLPEVGVRFYLCKIFSFLCEKVMETSAMIRARL